MLPVLLSLLSAVPSIQQAPQSAYVGTRSETEVAIPRLEQSADIDGVLDDPAWSVRPF